MPGLRTIELIECTHERLHSNCRICGVYMHPDIEAYKTYLYQSDSTTSNRRHLRSLQKSLKKFEILPQKFIYSQAIYNFLDKVTTKFEFSIETMALGVYLFNLLLEKKSINRSSYMEQMEFYSSVCLIAGAKSLQLDKNIPYLSRYQRHAEKSHTKEQYQKVEAEILQEFQFDLQIPTFITFLSFYLSNGILFQNDSFNKTRIFVLEEKVREIAIKYLRNGSFVTQDQEKLAARVILQARKECRLKWNRIIEEYSLMPLEKFEEHEILKPLNIHHSFTTLPLLNKSIHINRSLKKLNQGSKKDLEEKFKGKILERCGSARSIPLVHGLHFKSLNRVQ